MWPRPPKQGAQCVLTALQAVNVSYCHLQGKEGKPQLAAVFYELLASRCSAAVRGTGTPPGTRFSRYYVSSEILLSLDGHVVKGVVSRLEFVLKRMRCLGAGSVSVGDSSFPDMCLFCVIEIRWS